MMSTVAEHTVTLDLVRTETAQYKKKTINLPVYNVLLDDQVIGRVSRSMISRERRGKGLRYVYARWQSPGWRYTAEVGRLGLECQSRRDGIERLLGRRGFNYLEARELASSRV